ncbi:MAG: hypothetical protein AAFW88_09385 [Pseudomonadota bacterium]
METSDPEAKAFTEDVKGLCWRTASEGRYWRETAAATPLGYICDAESYD